METYRLLGMIFLLLSFPPAKAESSFPSAKAEKKFPSAHVNLSPFQAWRSAYECILIGEESDVCSPPYKLSMKGVITVRKEETPEYCREDGCGEHVQSVLKCIHQVKRDFWFANKATVQDLQDAISTGCNTSSEIDTSDYQKSAANKYLSFSKSFVLALPTVLFMFVFNM